MHKFLDGVRVIELGHILLGPMSGQTLGDLGADVVKVEAIGGDLYRTVGTKQQAGMSAQWLNCNRNKRSISLNLKTDEGKAVLTELIKSADVFIHNMRPKAVARLGFDYDTCKALNPSLVYCFSSGYGQDGPYRDLPAFDDIIQARSGLADINGAVDGVPKLTPMAITDLTTSQALTQAVLAGLYRRASSNQGCIIEVPMFETFVSLVMNQHLNGHAFHPPSAPVGYQRMLSPFRRPCATADGFIVHGVYTFEHWTRFLPRVGRDELLNSPLLASPDDMGQHIADLYQIMAEDILPEHSSDYWLKLFDELDIPCAPVTRLADLETDDHLRAVGLFSDYEHPSGQTLRAIRSPFNVGGCSESPDIPPPSLGADTKSILTELGMAEDTIEELRARGVVNVS